VTDLPARRLLLVHAHPDDESINNGATMARYATGTAGPAERAHVTLVTCTRGEEGEVIPAGLAHLAPGREDALGPYRVGELAAAMRELGVTDHRFLGGEGRYRDSGMMGVPSNDRPGAFWRADLDEAAAHLVAIVREVRPQVLVGYDPDGGYGHPDHIQAHRVAMRAAELAADPAFAPHTGPAHQIAKVYWNCVPRDAVEEGFGRLRAALEEDPGLFDGFLTGVAEVADVPGVVEPGAFTARVEGPGLAERKAAAMRAHATQIVVDGPFFALSNALGQPLLGTEYFRLVRGTAAPAPGAPWEDDLFAGLGLPGGHDGYGGRDGRDEHGEHEEAGA
jgi:N-acetyl-1-D-myo-inositol-2-amino-2-deoxy-alpha-D-glucopyranoside deacetylase